MAVESPGCRTAAYRRRRPEQTALYKVVQQHLETYLTLAACILSVSFDDAHAIPALQFQDVRHGLFDSISGGSDFATSPPASAR